MPIDPTAVPRYLARLLQQRSLDAALVYELYGLTEEEIAIVEGRE